MGRYEGRITAAKGKTIGLSATKTGTATGHSSATGGSGRTNKKTGLAALTGRGLTRRGKQ